MIGGLFKQFPDNVEVNHTHTDDNHIPLGMDVPANISKKGTLEFAKK
jgi:hypothetical protein